MSKRLTAAIRRRRAAARVLDQRTEEMYDVIREEHENGKTLRQLAAETGVDGEEPLTFGRIGQIVRGER